MSHFACERCGTVIFDSISGYLTGCEHYGTEAEARASEKFRHEAEVRTLVAMKSNAERLRYLRDVLDRRGPGAAQRIREDAWRVMKRLESV